MGVEPEFNVKIFENKKGKKKQTDEEIFKTFRNSFKDMKDGFVQYLTHLCPDGDTDKTFLVSFREKYVDDSTRKVKAKVTWTQEALDNIGGSLGCKKQVVIDCGT